MTLYKWSQTAAADATADSTINWAEGQAPSSVNDSARAMMAAVAKYRDDTGGKIGATGTTGAFVVTTNQGFTSLAAMDSQSVSFVAPSTNDAGCTLNVDGLGAKPIAIDSSGTAIPAGVLVAGTVYQVTYYNSVGQFRLWNLYANPFNIPIAGGMDYWGPSAPNSNFALPAGQAISRATYATLFAIVGTTYGAGDGSTTFNLPDKTGRVSAMKEAIATRLTAAGGGVDGATMGAAGGAQTKTLVTANLPPYTPAGSVSVLSTLTDWIRGGIPDNYSSISGFGTYSGPTKAQIASTGTLTGTAQGGTSTPFGVVPPTIVCNYIMRII